MADADTKDRRQAETLHNPASDPNSGNVAWIFIALMFGSLAWFLVDPTLRRGLSQATGIQWLSPVIEELITTEYTIQLHGSWTSTCTQRVLLVAHEKELDIRLSWVNTTAMQHKSDSHLLMQPFGQIPVLELEDHQYLFESRAITQFLARRYADRGTPLHVHGLMAKAFYEEALSIEAFDFDPLAAAIFREAVMKPRSGALADATAIALAKTSLEKKLDGYEKLLSGRHWLGGYNMTLADLYHLPLGQKIIDAGHGAALMDAKSRPNVAKWWKALSERPAWKAVLSDVEKWQEAEAKRRAEEQAAAEKA